VKVRRWLPCTIASRSLLKLTARCIKLRISMLLRPLLLAYPT